jgi:chromosome segregation ATPase
MGWAKGQHNTASHIVDGFLPWIVESTEELADARHEIDELRAIIQTTREKFVTCSEQFSVAQRELEDQRAITESKDELLLDLQNTLEETSHTIEELMEHYSRSVTEVTA